MKRKNLVCRDYSKCKHAHMHARMHTYTHTGTRTHACTDCTKLNLHNLKQAANRDLKRTAWNRKHSRSIALSKKKTFVETSYDITTQYQNLFMCTADCRSHV